MLVDLLKLVKKYAIIIMKDAKIIHIILGVFIKLGLGPIPIPN
jgi:hypothetical protein